MVRQRRPRLTEGTGARTTAHLRRDVWCLGAPRATFSCGAHFRFVSGEVLSGSDGRADGTATGGGLPQNSTVGPTGTMSRSRAPKPRWAGTDLALETRSINPLGGLPFGQSRGRLGAAGPAGDGSSTSCSDAYVFGLPRGRASSGIEFSATHVGQVPSLAVVQSSRRRRLPPSGLVASRLFALGLKAPRAGQPIFHSGRRRHGAPTFGGSSPEHGRHPSSGIEGCAFGGIRPVS